LNYYDCIKHVSLEYPNNLVYYSTALSAASKTNIWKFYFSHCSYRAFHGFGQVKFPDGCLVLGLSQFLILPKLPPKILFDSKVVKIDPKIIISLRLSKYVTQSVHIFPHIIIFIHLFPSLLHSTNRFSCI